MSQVYQWGSIRRIKRASGKDAWESRYRVNGKIKQQALVVSQFPGEEGSCGRTLGPPWDC